MQGKAEYIGRTIARARVKLVSEPYGPPDFPPSLEWYRVTRGSEPAGELLAVFELLEYEESSGLEPRLPEPKLYKQGSAAAGSEITITELIDEGPIFPVPCGIRPTLSRYRLVVSSQSVAPEVGFSDEKSIFHCNFDKIFLPGSKFYFGDCEICEESIC